MVYSIVLSIKLGREFIKYCGKSEFGYATLEDVKIIESKISLVLNICCNSIIGIVILNFGIRSLC